MFDWLFKREPWGYTLIRRDGQRHNRIRGDLIPRDVKVIMADGRIFVREDKRDRDNFEIYREGHSTFTYRSVND